MILLGRTPKQWLFSDKERLSFLLQWQRADKYNLSTKEFCQSLIDNGTDTFKLIGLAGKEAPKQGKRFVDVLEGWFPMMVLSSIQAAESAGQRSVGIQTAIEQLQGGESIVSKLAQMLAFPFALTIGAGLYGIYIADKMLSAVEHGEGVGLTVRNLVAGYGPFVAIGCVCLLVALAIALPNWANSGRHMTNQWPLFSLYRTAVAATLLKNLANLTQCGMKLSDALTQAETRNSAFAKMHIQSMKDQSIGQSNLGHILDTQLLLPDELSTIKVLGERVNYTELLRQSGANHSQHVDKQMAKMKLWLPKAGLVVTILVLGSLVVSAAYQLYLSFQ